MIRRDTYVITGIKEWSTMYWQGRFLYCDGKLARHYRLVKICLDVLNGQQAVLGLTRQYGYTKAWEEANIIYNSKKLNNAN